MGLKQLSGFNEPHIEFTDVADSAGIQFKHFFGTRTNQMPEDMGSGAAWFDYDQDGWQDLFVSNIAGPLTMSQNELQHSPAHAKLFHNNGDGTFTDVTRKAGVGWHGYGMGVATGDYDNDGWPDLFLASRGHNQLFHNNGDGTFSNVSKQAGLYNFKGFWSDGRWGDYDKDGYLDLYVTGYLQYTHIGPNRMSNRLNRQVPASLNPGPFRAERNLLFHNNGDGTFTERAKEAKVMNVSGKSLTATWCDFNNDGWPDILVANDMTQNRLYMNMKNGKFLDVRTLSYMRRSRSSMGIAVGDIDQDHDMDIFISNWLSEKNGLYINLLDRTAKGDLIHFQDMATPYGFGKPSMGVVGWGTGFYDFDNDSRLDLFVANGSTDPQKDNPHKLVPMSNQFFWNKGLKKGYNEVTQKWGTGSKKKLVSRGVAFADYDNDGDVDIFIVNHGGKAILLNNKGGNKNNWLEVSLTGSQSNRSALGTKLLLYSAGNCFVRQVGAQASYMSDNSTVEHFGLDRVSRIDSLVIKWPSGIRQTLQKIPLNKIVHITEGSSKIHF